MTNKKFLYLAFLVRQKFSHVSDANKVVKTKNGEYKIFKILLTDAQLSFLS